MNKEKLINVRQVIYKMVEGIDPYTDEPIDEHSFIHNAKLIRSLTFVSSVLTDCIEKGLMDQLSNALMYEASLENEAMIISKNKDVVEVKSEIEKTDIDSINQVHLDQTTEIDIQNKLALEVQIEKDLQDEIEKVIQMEIEAEYKLEQVFQENTNKTAPLVENFLEDGPETTDLLSATHQEADPIVEEVAEILETIIQQNNSENTLKMSLEVNDFEESSNEIENLLKEMTERNALDTESKLDELALVLEDDLHEPLEEIKEKVSKNFTLLDNLISPMAWSYSYDENENDSNELLPESNEESIDFDIEKMSELQNELVKDYGIQMLDDTNEPEIIMPLVDFSIKDDELDNIVLPDGKITIDQFCLAVNDHLTLENRKAVSSDQINRSLKAMGLLLSAIDEEGNPYTKVYNNSHRFGIILQERDLLRNQERQIMYNDLGKMFLKDNLQKIIDYKRPQATDDKQIINIR